MFLKKRDLKENLNTFRFIEKLQRQYREALHQASHVNILSNHSIIVKIEKLTLVDLLLIHVQTLFRLAIFPLMSIFFSSIHPRIPHWI